MTESINILAADIGGTHARLGVVAVQSGHDGGPAALSLQHYTKYKCADYGSIDAIFSDFVAKQQLADFDYTTVASAGYFKGDTLCAINLPWSISLGSLRDTLRSKHVYGINDYEALASATFGVSKDIILKLNPVGIASTEHARVVLGPGTGLGAAASIPHGSACVTLTTEVGNAAFAPASKRDVEIREVLARKYDFVCIEHLLSGPGLANIYIALAEVMDQPAIYSRPSEISGAALNGGSDLALASLNAFCEILGSVCGDLALTYGARGGVYLAGGILPKFSSFLGKSRFLDCFLAKGDMKSYLQHIPVNLINHGSLGVLGAANWCLNHQKISGHQTDRVIGDRV